MTTPAIPRNERGFKIKIASSGDVFDVASNQSILAVLSDQGFNIETSCEKGLCATCMTGYLEGEPDHRDLVLDEEEQAMSLCVCISRSNSPMLVLDL